MSQYRVQRRTCFGQDNLTHLALKQRQARVLLKESNLMTNRSWCDPDLGSSTLESAMSGCRLDYAEGRKRRKPSHSSPIRDFNQEILSPVADLANAERLRAERRLSVR